MEIFVEKDGNRIGPYTQDLLREAFDRGDYSGAERATVSGMEGSLSVAEIFSTQAPASAPPRPNLAATPAAIPSIPERRQELGSRPQSEYEDTAESFPIENFRFIGAATPVAMLLVMLAPWAAAPLLELGTVNGYTMFSMMTFPTLLFAISAAGIGLYGFEGASEGGIRGPLRSFGCALFAIGTLAYLTLYRTHSDVTEFFELGLIELRGGWHFTMGTILIGTAGAILPSSEFSQGAKIGFWVVSGLFAIAGGVFVFLGFSV